MIMKKQYHWISYYIGQNSNKALLKPFLIHYEGPGKWELVLLLLEGLGDKYDPSVY